MRVVRWAEQVAASLFFTLFPADCRFCNAPLIQVSRFPVCRDCLQHIRPLSNSVCSICGEGLDYHSSLNAGEVRCAQCQASAPPFERAVAYGGYEGTLRDLIHLLKFEQIQPLGSILGQMLSEVIRTLEPLLPEGRIAIVPVPLHRRKQSQRGFNQAEIIARFALKKLARPDRFELCRNTLRRMRETGSQIGLTRNQRRENLRGAFSVENAASIAGRDVLLIDDVYTTGATACECAQVLRRAGAKRVWVATVARTLKISNFSLVPDDFSENQSFGPGEVNLGNETPNIDDVTKDRRRMAVQGS